MFEVRERFKLSEKFLEEFRGQQPKWGPLGYVTFKRTYARPIHEEGQPDRTEEYWESLRRVVEGCYTIQLNHCKSLKLPWIPFKAQKSAQEMYRLMWNFKFLPPGRGQPTHRPNPPDVRRPPTKFVLDLRLASRSSLPGVLHYGQIAGSKVFVKLWYILLYFHSLRGFN